MNITLIIITLNFLPNGLINKMEQEIIGYKTLSECLMEQDKVIFHYENLNKNNKLKLISVTCKHNTKA